jgi:hypothetical protein
MPRHSKQAPRGRPRAAFLFGEPPMPDRVARRVAGPCGRMRPVDSLLFTGSPPRRRRSTGAGPRP